MRDKFLILALFISTFLVSGCEKLVVLNSKGPIGQQETVLIYVAFGLMLIVVIPVFVLGFWFAIRYRASHKNPDYHPAWSDSKKIDFVIWAVPVIIVVLLSFLLWTKTYQLDPYKPIASDAKPLQIEVISLDWNWLFIYPDNDIALLNELVIPANVPLSFKLTSASVMTSFFIPQLGSQMYAMAGMRTRLHLLAEEPGTYEGYNFEFSGKGYATMHFKVQAKTPQQFAQWLAEAKSLPHPPLTLSQFKTLEEPEANRPVTLYSPVEKGLFDKVMQPYTGWMSMHEQMQMPLQNESIHTKQDK